MQTDQADLTVDVLSTIQPPGKIVIYPERFSYRYIGMVAKNSGSQKIKFWGSKKEIYLTILIFSITGLCFFVLTRSKVYFQVRKRILSIVNNCKG